MNRRRRADSGRLGETPPGSAHMNLYMNQNNTLNPVAQAILNTYQAVPHAKADAKRITALVKYRGRIVGYQLSDASVVSKEDGVSMAKRGEIAGVGIGIRKGSEYLKALPDQREGNNLGSLPSVPAR